MKLVGRHDIVNCGHTHFHVHELSVLTVYDSCTQTTTQSEESVRRKENKSRNHRAMKNRKYGSLNRFLLATQPIVYALK